MTVPEGHFRLYPSMRPHLTAGSYRFRTTQPLQATAKDGSTRTSAQLPVDSLTTHVDVTSPRYQLPPDQILSTYPPAGSEGAYGSRLPQICIKRRTLPWERDVVPGTQGPTPWLALVVIAEGEAELVLNAPVADCVTPGTSLPGTPDVSTASYLKVRRSVIDSVLPTRKDVPLLAHVREVDISDTELMMGDDDGFVAVVVANRLPLAARSTAGDETPVKYLAALISFEGQLSTLLPEAPAHTDRTSDLISSIRIPRLAPEMDVVLMTGGDPVINPADMVGTMTGIGDLVQHGGGQIRARSNKAQQQITHSVLAPDAATIAYSAAGGWPTDRILDTHAVTQALSKDFLVSTVTSFADPVFRYPVLAHWSFTSVGDTTFESLMTNLDSGLVGTPPKGPPPDGRPPLNVVETGHVELPHRTRHGDLTSAWYRGPLSPHPTDTTAPRLPLAHAADQLRIVVPDGREDLSLASAFEIGRLMALSHPSLVDSLLRWRQQRFQVVRGRSVIESLLDLRIDKDLVRNLRDLPHELGLMLARPLVKGPEEIMGIPLELLKPGTDMRIVDQLSLDASLGTAIAQGLAIDADLGVSPGEVLGILKDQQVHTVADLDPRAAGTLVSKALHGVLDAKVSTLAASALGTKVVEQFIGGDVAVWEGIDAADVGGLLTGLGGISVGRGGRLTGLRDLTDIGDLTDVGGPTGPGGIDIRPRDALDDLVDGAAERGDTRGHDAPAGGSATTPGDES
jgi:hypothetical protein